MRYFLFDEFAGTWSEITYSVEELQGMNLDPAHTFLAEEGTARQLSFADALKEQAPRPKKVKTSGFMDALTKPIEVIPLQSHPIAPPTPVPFEVERAETLRLVRLLCRFIFALASFGTVCGGIGAGVLIDIHHGGAVGALIGGVAGAIFVALLFLWISNADEDALRDAEQDLRVVPSKPKA